MNPWRPRLEEANKRRQPGGTLTHQELALGAIDRAVDALNDAAAELTVAMALAPRDSALANYAYVRAIDRLQAELDAAREALNRD